MESWDSGGHGGDAMWRGTDGPLHISVANSSIFPRITNDNFNGPSIMTGEKRLIIFYQKRL